MLICKECFADDELRAEVESNATTDGVCEVCGTKGRLIDFSYFADFFNAVLLLFEPNTEGRTIVEVLQDEWHLFQDNRIARVILNSVLCSSNYGYSVDSHVSYSFRIKQRVLVWNRLKESVKHKSRFFTDIDELVRYKYLETNEGLRTGIKLFRSRVLPPYRKKFSHEEMGCPPPLLASAGRANPLGIPYLYLSESAKTTYFEVRAVYLDRLSVGTFRVVRNLHLVDFKYDVNLFVAFTDGSMSLEEVVIKKKVINAISADLSKPLRRYDSELEYVPTQLICEFCKEYIEADGICFKSSLYADGMNYVLFDPQDAQCIRVSTHEITKIDIDRK